MSHERLANWLEEEGHRQRVSDPMGARHKGHSREEEPLQRQPQRQMKQAIPLQFDQWQIDHDPNWYSLA